MAEAVLYPQTPQHIAALHLFEPRDDSDCPMEEWDKRIDRMIHETQAAAAREALWRSRP